MCIIIPLFLRQKQTVPTMIATRMHRTMLVPRDTAVIIIVESLVSRSLAGGAINIEANNELIPANDYSD